MISITEQHKRITVTVTSVTNSTATIVDATRKVTVQLGGTIVSSSKPIIDSQGTSLPDQTPNGTDYTIADVVVEGAAIGITSSQSIPPLSIELEKTVESHPVGGPLDGLSFILLKLGNHDPQSQNPIETFAEVFVRLHPQIQTELNIGQKDFLIVDSNNETVKTITHAPIIEADNRLNCLLFLSTGYQLPDLRYLVNGVLTTILSADLAFNETNNTLTLEVTAIDSVKDENGTTLTDATPGDPTTFTVLSAIIQEPLDGSGIYEEGTLVGRPFEEPTLKLHPATDSEHGSQITCTFRIGGVEIDTRFYIVSLDQNGQFLVDFTPPDLKNSLGTSFGTPDLITGGSFNPNSAPPNESGRYTYLSPDIVTPDGRIVNTDGVPFGLNTPMGADVEHPDLDFEDDLGNPLPSQVWKGSGPYIITGVGGGSPDPPIVRFRDPTYAHGITSYANFDGPWLQQAGHLVRVHPDEATIQQEIDYSQSNGLPPWRGLVHQNHHGNYERYTLTDGTQSPYNTYTPHGRIIQDHLTGLEWVYPDDITRTWVNCLHDPTIVYQGKTGWRTAQMEDFAASAVVIGNHPMIAVGLRGGTQYWTGTPIPSNTSRVLQFYNINTSGKAFLSLPKTSSLRCALVRFMQYDEL